MSSPLRKYNTYKNTHYESLYEKNHSYYDAPIRQHKKITKKHKTKKRNFIATFFALSLLASWGYFVCPYIFKHYFEPLFLNRVLNKNLKIDIEPYVYPTRNYLSNSFLIDKNLLVSKADKSKEITDIQVISELTDTKNKLITLFQKYPNLKPSVFVWEYSTGAGLEINSDEVYPSASIIKIPIAFELIRLIDRTSDTQNPISLTDKRAFTEEFRTLGSGNLQYTKAGNIYSLDHLANIMISDSDNSATNMLLYEIGGVDAFNRSMRNLGLKVTSMAQWLPDLEGENKITAREISKILYNIDNPNYINVKYKNILKEYLGNTKNIHLLKEKLPKDAMVLHKTGNIASMLGDSGIIYTDNGKKYIVTILVKRPNNDLSARTLIQDASQIIYNDIKTLQ